MTKTTLKLFGGYLLILLLMVISSNAFGQVVVTHFNAAWNNPDKVSYIGDLTECDKDGEEMERFQADISFSMKATRKEMQGVIDELIMSDF